MGMREIGVSQKKKKQEEEEKEEVSEDTTTRTFEMKSSRITDSKRKQKKTTLQKMHAFQYHSDANECQEGCIPKNYLCARVCVHECTYVCMYVCMIVRTHHVYIVAVDHPLR
jgi:hypothetical protein